MRQPLLMYHAITRGKADSTYSVDEKDFIGQMELVRNGGYRTLTVDEYYGSFLRACAAPPDRSVIITFDDGHGSDESIAAPILSNQGLKASFFVTTGWIGKPGYMSGAQLRRLSDAGMPVHSHAKTHRFLDGLNAAEVTSELESSKKALEDILGRPVPFISFPGGRYNRTVIECAVKAGYCACFTSVPFSLKRHGDLFLAGRTAIKGSTGAGGVARILKMNPLEKTAMRYACHGKDFLKKVFGNKAYYLIWKMYNKRQTP